MITRGQALDVLSEWMEIYTICGEGDIKFYNDKILNITVALYTYTRDVPRWAHIELFERLKEIVDVKQDNEKYIIFIKDDPTSCWYVKKNQQEQ